MLQIKPVESHQLDELVELSRQTFIDGFKEASNPENFDIYVRDNLNLQVLSDELSASKTRFFFAYDAENELVGYLKMRWDRSTDFFADGDAVELQRIYFLKAHWSKGYGSELLHFAENFARMQGKTWIYLIVWLENKGAIRFYERENYEYFARKNFQFGEEIHYDFAYRKNLK